MVYPAIGISKIDCDFASRMFQEMFVGNTYKHVFKDNLL